MEVSMTRIHNIGRLTAVLAILVFVVTATASYAAGFGDLKAKIGEARDTIVVMVKNKDKRGPDQQKLVKDSANAVSEMLGKMKAPAGKEAQFKELNETWAAFKKTRENDLVPMLIAGKQEDADRLAGGIQKERFGKIMALCDELAK